MDLGEKIKHLRKALRMTQTQLGKELGVTQPTVARWEGGAEPGYEYLQKLATLAKKDVEEFASVGGTPEARGSFRVVGEVQAGVWKEALQWALEDQYILSLPPDRRFPEAERFGLLVRGTSMNLIYPEGTILVCVKLIDIDRQPQPGDKVIVHRRCKDGLVEATCKVYELDASGHPWLIPRSTDPQHQPIPADRPSDEAEAVEITGLVTASIRPE